MLKVCYILYIGYGEEYCHGVNGTLADMELLVGLCIGYRIIILLTPSIGELLIILWSPIGQLNIILLSPFIGQLNVIILSPSIGQLFIKYYIIKSLYN